MVFTRLFSLTLLWCTAYAVVASICASTNVASSVFTTSLYMSNGLCSDDCSNAGYSIAIVQDESCWCSNSVPSDTTSLIDCSVQCPGYPEELCGNADEGLYGYIVLGSDYSTVGSSSRTSTSGTSSSATGTSSSTTGTSSPNTGTTSSRSTTSTSATASDGDSTSLSPSGSTSGRVSSTRGTSSTSSTSASTSTSSPSSPSSSSSTSITPITSIVYSVMTVTGSATRVTTTQVVSTVVSIPTSSSSTSSNPSASTSKGFFDSPGKVAGTFVAVGIVILAIIGTLLYLCCFRKQHDDDDDDEESATTSHHSEKHPPADVLAPQDELMSAGDDFVEVDQRLDPRQMFNWEGGSRQSLADDMDYSRRVLRVTNV